MASQPPCDNFSWKLDANRLIFVYHNPPKKCRMSRKHCEKTDYTCFKESGKGSNILRETINAYCSPNTWLKLRWNSSLTDLFIYGDTHTPKFVTLKILAKVMMYNICSATFDGKYVTSYLMATVKFAHSHSLRDIRKTRIMPQFDLKNEGQA